jgi:hypothetical protein
MTDEERRRIIAEGRATLARLRRFAPSAAAELPPIDPVEKWRREMSVFDAERQAAERELRSETTARADWAAIDARIDARLEQERAMVMDVVGEAIGELLAEERAKMFAEYNALRDLCAKYIDSATRIFIADDEKNGVDRSPIDMPSPFASRRDVN